MFSKPKSVPPPRRDTFELKAWPPTVKGEGRGLWVAVLGLIVILAMTAFGVNAVATNGINLTVRIVQQEPATPVKPPP